ncbi:twin-arginine translocation signal domain-containing protein [Flammeovirga pectinis]|uniref:Twin-arginine translocation signal domain-containing protein n=1 Tax=Flammeovirga pectinis TaxID=2494373 RepID=A0A3S9P9Y4_9BACT|nr:Gfo/Idh/MocA family oxidoreductase [Flammeovirga pectinis]AZQ65016.1 twin-arginine translocation signal domain-containing protein [Flammeovirga pectinis]
MNTKRRDFLKTAAIAGAGTIVAPGMGFAKSKNEKVKLAFIGTGARGIWHLNNALLREDTEVVAICDTDDKAIKNALKYVEKHGKKKPQIFGKNELDYRNMLDLKEVQGVIISTPWVWHTPMSVDSMKAGKFTGVEVSAAMTLQECWDLVNVHEETGSHLMILENVCYRRDVMAVLQMVREGMFGESMHARCGYQHDLRNVKFNNGVDTYGGGVEFGEKGASEAKWRTHHSLHKNGDLYPTHGAGPVATYMDINRGNKFDTISSFATKARGLNEYIIEKGGKDHPNANLPWKLGDIVTSTISTANGETIIVTHDTNLPRPYSLGFRFQGTKGLWEHEDGYSAKHGNLMYIDGQTKPHQWDDAKQWLDKYDHPLWAKYGETATGAGHGGMDFFVMHDFVNSIKHNIAPPLDAYDAAAWSAITPLSERSIEEGGAVQHFPDFTRGKWFKREPIFGKNEVYL